jgi:predicted nucleotide-binding protein (sugar kinase/HSP70/actin superfamily)
MNNKTIGIPQALTYYINNFRWEGFLHILGYKTILSSTSTRKTFNLGFKHSANDQCLPIKTFYGHIIELMEKNPDAIFIPQFISLKAATYGCPLVNAAPLFAQSLSRASKKIPIWMITIDYNYPRLTLLRVWWFAIKRANNFSLAFKAVNYYKKNFFTPMGDTFFHKIPEQKTIGIIARSYVLNDHFLNANLFGRLKNLGFNVVTSLSYQKPIDRNKTYFGYNQYIGLMGKLW